MGGLSRRNTVIENQRQRGPLMVVDAGGSLVAHSVNADQIGQHALEQRRLKADLIGEAYAQAGIDAMGLNAADWTLGGSWVREMVTKHDLPVLAGNLFCEGEPPFPGHKIVEVAGRRVGVVGITFGAVDGCEVTDPRRSLETSIAAVGDVDLVLALAPGNEPTKLGLALEGKPVLGIDLLLDGRGRHSYRSPDNMSGVWMMGAGSRGKSVGQVDFVWTEGATQWAPAGQENQNQVKLQRAMQRLASTQKRFDEEKDPQRKSRWGAQVEAYEAQLATLQVELDKPVEDTFNLFAGSVVDLDKSVKDHAATHDLVDNAKENMS
ncbi:MAG: hypothetical protein GWP91_00295, partial [Rhodobacterales bacterium]|nr:hypothetical protein [Rhodobacterales bacterium]